MDKSRMLVGRQTNDVGEKRQCVQRPCGQGSKDTTQNLLGMSTRDGSITAKDLAVDHRRPNGLFGGPVGRLDIRIIKKRQDLIIMSSQVLLKLAIAGMREVPFQQTVQPLLQSAARHGQAMGTDGAAVPPIAKGQRIAEKFLDLSGESNRAASGSLQQRFGSPQQVFETLLVRGLLEEIVRRPAVVTHASVVVRSQNRLGYIMAPAGTNHTERGRWRDEYPQPLQPAGDLPAGFVRIDKVTPSHDLLNRLIGRLVPFGDTKDYLGRSAPAHRDSEGLVQQALDVTVTESILVLHHRDQRLQIRAQLRRGGPEGIRGLPSVSRLDPPATPATSANVDIEPTHKGLARNLDLELLIDMVFFGRPSAGGALIGQGHVDDLVRLLIGKRTMDLGTVVLARFTAGLFRILFRGSLGEWSSLPLLGPRGLFQELRQLRHALLEFSDLRFEPGTVRTPYCCIRITSHDTNIGKMAA